MIIKYCRKCKIQLDKDNWKSSAAKRKDYICKPCLAIQHNIQKQILKQKVIDEYGGKCTCCGEDNSIFLSIDHIDDSGSKHRKSLSLCNPTGNTFYRWLRKQGYPKENYQLLCFNCNFAKHVLGKCPHQTTPA